MSHLHGDIESMQLNYHWRVCCCCAGTLSVVIIEMDGDEPDQVAVLLEQRVDNLTTYRFELDFSHSDVDPSQLTTGMVVTVYPDKVLSNHEGGLLVVVELVIEQVQGGKVGNKAVDHFFE